MTKRQALLSLTALIGLPAKWIRAEEPLSGVSTENGKDVLVTNIPTKYAVFIDLESFGAQYALGVGYKGKELKFSAEEIWVALGGQL